MQDLNFPIDPVRLPRPADLERGKRGIERWLDLAEGEDDQSLAAFIRALPEDPRGRALIEAVAGNSPFLCQCMLREPAFVRQCLETGFDQAFAALMDWMRAEAHPLARTDQVKRVLRIAKRRAALLIALADIAEIWPLETVTGALSDLASTGLCLAAAHLLRQGHENGDIVLPCPDQPETDSGLIVLGMGKLGARELNYSSDIDIIVLYDSDKVTYRGRKSVQEFFARLTRDLAKIMEEPTGDGYFFRTDLRLRPDPGSTPPAISLSAAETYYESFGQNWERAAMIKARAVAGDLAVGQSFIRFLRPFIWRRNLDFAAIQDIHSIKRQINAHRGGHAIAVIGHNIKLGRGGIREIEFFAQTQQLIWGGRETNMRSSATCASLRALAAAGHIGEAVAEAMIEAYHYLRRLEHRLQMIDDQQTQTLPSDRIALVELAIFAGHDGFEAFAADLLRRLQTVESHYARLFEDAPALGVAGGSLVFTGGENDPETLKTISAMGFADAAMISSTIRGWHHGRVRAMRSTRAREMLTELTPALLKALGKTANPDQAFLRFADFVARLPAGVPLFSLLYANPDLLGLLADIMGDAPKLAEHLSRNAALLDGVLSPDFLGSPTPPAELIADLDRVLGEAEDFQAVLDLSRRWANDQKFRIGILVLRNLITAEEAGTALSDIADAVLSRMLPKVEDELARAHGRIPGAGMVVVGMGKLGSREMTASSDLDLILIYDVPPGTEASDGAKPLAPSVYYARLTQRFLNAITAKTAEGALYEVDMRLRPSGNAGPIATSLEAFDRYQAEMAWTWEHQALTRARIIAGSPDLATKVGGVIRDTLTRPRHRDTLLADVAEMRDRMAKEHRNDNPFEVKHLRGGLIDIEFLAQYLQLRHGRDHLGILLGGTAPVLREAERLGLIAEEDSRTLLEALHVWAALQSVLRQTLEGSFREAEAPLGLKQLLARSAGCEDFEHLKERMATCAEAALDVYRRLIEEPAQPLREARKEEAQ